MPEGKKNTYTIVVLQIFILAFAVLIGHSLGKAQVRSNTSDYVKLEMISQAIDRIKDRYIEENVDEEKLVYGAIKGMTEALDDPYSQFMPPDMYKETMDDTKGKYGGLGIEISMDLINDYKRLTVGSVFDDTPAYKAGMETGDHIVKIDGELTYGISLESAKHRLRGEPGTKVVLTVMRDSQDETIDITVTRGLIRPTTVKARMLEGDIGFIRISQFSDTTPKDVDEKLEEFERAKVKGIILDLRMNPGGTLSAAVDVASDFLKEGQLVVYTKGREEDDYKEFLVESEAPHPWHPLVVLIDQWSASGSEIVVGAIKDHKRGIIVGGEKSTFGKGSVQTIFPMPDGETGLKLTVANYYTPSGKNINKVGIEPDIKYPGLTLTPSEMKMRSKLRDSETLKEFIKEAGDDILDRLKRNGKRGEENPDEQLFRSFIKKLSQEDIVLSENLIKRTIAMKTQDDADEYEYDPAIRFAINHLRALEVVNNE